MQSMTANHSIPSHYVQVLLLVLHKSAWFGGSAGDRIRIVCSVKGKTTMSELPWMYYQDVEVSTDNI